MRTLVLVVVSIVFLMAVGAVYAQDKPTVTQPTEGAVLGPNYDIIGSMPHKAFLVLVTDVVRTDTNEVVRTVPGIRHWTNDDGTFQFRAASPRVSLGEKDLPLLYRVRICESTKDGNGPETLINTTMAQP